MTCRILSNPNSGLIILRPRSSSPSIRSVRSDKSDTSRHSVVNKNASLSSGISISSKTENKKSTNFEVANAIRYRYNIMQKKTKNYYHSISLDDSIKITQARLDTLVSKKSHPETQARLTCRLNELEELKAEIKEANFSIEGFIGWGASGKSEQTRHSLSQYDCIILKDNKGLSFLRFLKTASLIHKSSSSATLSAIASKNLDSLKQMLVKSDEYIDVPFENTSSNLESCSLKDTETEKRVSDAINKANADNATLEENSIFKDLFDFLEFLKKNKKVEPKSIFDTLTLKEEIIQMIELVMANKDEEYKNSIKGFLFLFIDTLLYLKNENYFRDGKKNLGSSVSDLKSKTNKLTTTTFILEKAMKLSGIDSRRTDLKENEKIVKNLNK